MEGKLEITHSNLNVCDFFFVTFCILISLIKHHLCENRNLVDAANIAALAALSTFRRPECTLGGEDGQELIVHPPDVSFLCNLISNLSVCL